MFGPGEWALIAGIAVLIFGPSLFVKTAKSMGQGVAEFKNAMNEGEKAAQEPDEETKESEEEGKPAPAQP